MPQPSIETSIARSNLYLFISVLYSQPGNDRFEMLLEDEFKLKIKSAVTSLFPTSQHGNLNNIISEIFQLASSEKSQLSDNYFLHFGHTLSKETVPYELEQLPQTEIFNKTDRLADILGFYNAFGIQPDMPERGDHISMQTEFLSFLLLKMALAIEKGEDITNLQTCEKAFHSFWNEHFSNWIQFYIPKTKN